MKMTLSNTALYNIEIDDFLSKYELPYYIGVFSSNTIPKLPAKCVFICNLSNDYQDGTHFITICKIFDKLIIFDSLALNMTNDALLKKLQSFASTFIHLREPIQSINSQSCGLFCIFFVLLYHNSCITSIKYHNIIQFEKYDLKKNDIICAQNIKLLIAHLFGKTDRQIN